MRSTYSHEQNQLLKDMRENDESIADMATATQHSYDSVRHQLRKLKLTRIQSTKRRPNKTTLRRGAQYHFEQNLDFADRKCLSCGDNFESRWIGNRMCDTCKAWAKRQGNAFG